MRFIIYKITNLINGKIYIGKHKCKYLDDGYFGSGYALETAIKKYGKENFMLHLEFELQNQEEMDLLERSVVTKEFVELHSNYNMSVGGPNCILYGKANGFFGKHHSEETKRKIKESRKNFHQTEENKKRISLTLRKRYKEHPELRGAYVQNRGKVICLDKDGNRKYFYPDSVPDGYRIRILAHDIPHHVPPEVKEQNRKNQIERNHNSRWFNDGEHEIFCYPENCPKGYVRGRLPGLNVGRRYSEKTLLKMSLRARGRKASNSGKISITDGKTMTYIDKNSPIPEGWRRGMPKRKKS